MLVASSSCPLCNKQLQTSFTKLSNSSIFPVLVHGCPSHVFRSVYLKVAQTVCSLPTLAQSVFMNMSFQSLGVGFHLHMKAKLRDSIMRTCRGNFPPVNRFLFSSIIFSAHNLFFLIFLMWYANETIRNENVRWRTVFKIYCHDLPCTVWLKGHGTSNFRTSFLSTWWTPVALSPC